MGSVYLAGAGDVLLKEIGAAIALDHIELTNAAGHLSLGRHTPLRAPVAETCRRLVGNEV